MYHWLVQIVVGRHSHVEVVLVVVQREHKLPFLLSQKLADVLLYAHEGKPCELQSMVHLARPYLVVIIDNDMASYATEGHHIARDEDGSVAILLDVGQRMFVDHHHHLTIGGESHQSVVGRCPHIFTAPAGQRMYSAIGKPVGHRDVPGATVFVKNVYTKSCAYPQVIAYWQQRIDIVDAGIDGGLHWRMMRQRVVLQAVEPHATITEPPPSLVVFCQREEVV